MYDAFAEFINKSKVSKNDIDILYKEIILDPLYEDFVSGGEYAGLADHYIGRTIKQHDDLEFKLGLLKDENVEKIVNDAMFQSNANLSGIDTTVYIFPSAGDYVYMTDPLGGVAGCTLGHGKILILVDPTADNWESLLSYTVAHEYHHSIWTSQHAVSSFTLLDYLIFEGKADSFANIVFPDVEVPWTTSFDINTENTVWDSVEDQLNSSDQALLYTVMFGGITDYPQWSGYTIGYRIVQDYIVKYPEDSIAKWTKMSSSDILEKSGYMERQN